MKYNEIRELLPDYVRGMLNEKEAANIEKLIANSESLKRECEELRVYYESINALEPVKASENH